MATQYILAACLAAWIGLIYFFGTGRFGRGQTQRWIDWVEAHPRLGGLAPFLNRKHGFFRAAFHYVEFGLLCFLGVAAATGGTFEFVTPWPYAAWAFTCFLAWADETHQARTPGRMFRRIDFLHSLMGATGMLGVLFFYDFIVQFLLR